MGDGDVCTELNTYNDNHPELRYFSKRRHG